jgi:hypothetical protein
MHLDRRANDSFGELRSFAKKGMHRGGEPKGDNRGNRNFQTTANLSVACFLLLDLGAL